MCIRDSISPEFTKKILGDEQPITCRFADTPGFASLEANRAGFKMCIRDRSEDEETAYEGCLSFPGHNGAVTRPAAVKVRAPVSYTHLSRCWGWHWPAAAVRHFLPPAAGLPRGQSTGAPIQIGRAHV